MPRRFADGRGSLTRYWPQCAYAGGVKTNPKMLIGSCRRCRPLGSSSAHCVRALGGHFLSKIGQLPALLIQYFDLSLAVLNPQVNNGLHMFGIDCLGENIKSR